MREESMTRVLMVDDHKLMRIGLKSIFDECSDIEVVGEAENGEDALELTDKLKPDVVLMDIGLPVMDGIETTRHLKEEHPEIKVVILTSHAEENEVNSAINAGANAYALKDIKTEYLVMVIESVKEGAVWFDPNVAHLIKSKSELLKNGKPYSRASFREKHSNLTEREYEVLKLIVDGLSNAEIADKLSISEHTAKAHVCNIIQKLLVEDRTQAAVKALKERIV